MGRSEHDDSPHNFLPAALRAFPSPASVDEPMSSPGLYCTVNRSQLLISQSTPYDVATAAAVIPTMPDHVERGPIPTPMAESNVSSNPDALVGGPLAILPSAPPSPPPQTLRAGPGLRLPSFQQLGIAVPHPDDLEHAERSLLTPTDTADLPALDGVDLGANSIEDQQHTDVVENDKRALQSPIYHYVSTITPPTETGPLAWDAQPAVQTAGMHSPPTDTPSGAARTTESSNARDEVGGGAALSFQKEDSQSEHASEDERSWIDGAVDVILGNLQSTSRTIESVKVLSHALPSTSTTGHIFTRVINAIHESTPTSPLTPMTWINVFHAIPGRFNLADLPTSPPSTPGPAVGGEDYFTQKTFDSAVSIFDYQTALPLLPRSPRPVVPPSTIDISIVERYIPPSTSNEFAEMFDPNGSSILVDRLVELAPTNGSLLFIYPTRAGAETFMRAYLGPILDPTLRTMGVVHGLPADLCAALGSMAAVPDLPDHDTLARRIATLCARLTQQDSVAAARFHGGRRPRFTVAYAAKRYVRFARGVWAREWWVKQEKVRIKATLAQHAREAEAGWMRRGSGGGGGGDFAAQATTSTVLVQSLLDSVSGKEAQEKDTPEGAIEVSVVVIRRSL